MNKYVIGIDPGKNGGMAVLDDSGAIVTVQKMPETPRDVFDLLMECRRIAASCGCGLTCYMEAVGFGMPGQSSSATAKFARHCGHLDMALLALGIQTNTVTPQKWEKTYQLGKSSGYTKTEWKNRLKAKAQQLFPNTKVTLATADCLLIAEYGRKKEVGR